MDFFLHNFIADMYGPSFLIFYGIVIAVIWVFCSMRSPRTRRSDVPSLPLPANPDPYETAWLRDAERGVLQLAMFRLVQEGLLARTASGGQVLERVEHAKSALRLNAIERLLLDEAFVTPQRSTKVMLKYAKRIGDLCGEYERKALTAELVTPKERVLLSQRLAFWGVTIILGLGLYKLGIAVSRGRFNVVFLIVMALIGVVVTRILCRAPRLTRRGKEYLEGLRSTFFSERDQAEQNPSLAPLLIGVFGLSVLLGTPWADVLAVRPGDLASSGGDSSTFDSSSDSSGGGDSGGGDSGGGGCGGCGGGGGD